MGTTQPGSPPGLKYWHLKTVIGEALDSEFRVGEVLPNERELAARFGVARATLRQALEQLELEGRLQRRRGVGTTVAPPRIGVDVSTVRYRWPGARDDGWRVVGCVPAPPSAAAIRLLGAAPGPPVYAVRRLHATHGRTLATEQLYVPAASVPGLATPSSPTGTALARGVLHELERLPLEGQDRAVELGSAHADDARELDRLPGAPVLLVTTRYLSGDRTAAVSVATYRADACRLTFGDAEDLPIAS
ncbi:GntR family transcriptional regulator [Streptomyces somaliensis]|uniref:GntR family transcriptional regulator n=1 Tax=Streptomyces somaliensis TaxID=78355 RepID=UPI0020CC712F|nr:GntR family transcriptional regulator [Streptomyces somaliensis]MCP9946659.1 GntR family transcriptional regulator [Streptomyces somaliensis]MCP9960209.1 GntR family transcriptional regulator [Streptomyces somaliensis]MCP9963402.1 GntR family transcriptional regulator [Streptomyces somaliensis]MCP9963762.1 GntR family transcriptional regulator [Streptomyces somaliensis]MCP9972970.1 GntR family transcriptional regulator [Streptomyces somaliensis]